MIGERAARVRREVDDVEIAVVAVVVPIDAAHDHHGALAVGRDRRRRDGDDPAQVVELQRARGCGRAGAHRRRDGGGAGGEERAGELHATEDGILEAIIRARSARRHE